MEVTVLTKNSSIFSPGSLGYTNVYRHESDRGHTLPFILTFWKTLRNDDPKFHTAQKCMRIAWRRREHQRERERDRKEIKKVNCWTKRELCGRKGQSILFQQPSVKVPAWIASWAYLISCHLLWKKVHAFNSYLMKVSLTQEWCVTNATFIWAWRTLFVCRRDHKKITLSATKGTLTHEHMINIVSCWRSLQHWLSWERIRLNQMDSHISEYLWCMRIVVQTLFIEIEDIKTVYPI